jgi:hypothetical protein
MFKITSGKGFLITFKNGVTLSTQIGYYNYCDNYFSDDKSFDKIQELVNKNDWESKNCEIAIWDKDGNWLTDKILNIGDDVCGYVELDEWLEILEKCKNYKS